VGTPESRDVPDRTVASDREPSTERAESLLRAAKEAKLEEVERKLASNGDSIPLLLRRAGLLTELGHFEKAAHGYLRVLERDPNNPTALNNVGCVLVSMGKLTAARTVYQETARRHPGNATCRVNLGNVLMEESERLTAYQKTEQVLQLRREAREHYEKAVQLTPECKRAHEGLFYALRALGETVEADQHRRKAFEKRYIIPCAYRGDKAPVRVLQLMSTNGGNVRLQSFLDERIFQRYKVLPEFYKASTPLPGHHLEVNAIGDAELSSQALIDAQSLLESTRAPIINAPAAVLATTRVNNARRLSCLPGIVTPITTTFTREQCRAAGLLRRSKATGFRIRFFCAHRVFTRDSTLCVSKTPKDFHTRLLSYRGKNSSRCSISTRAERMESIESTGRC
jgi:tetratricopeptide (TPR) repeat protein